jgi:hypothetical protein
MERPRFSSPGRVLSITLLEGTSDPAGRWRALWNAVNRRIPYAPRLPEQLERWRAPDLLTADATVMSEASTG